jgi:nicotinate phosphoribosyltransferase
VIALHNEEDADIMYHPLFPHKTLSVGNKKKEALLHKVMEGGKRLQIL